VAGATTALQVAEPEEPETLPDVGEIPPLVSRPEAAETPPGPSLLWRSTPANVKDSNGEPDGRKVPVRFCEGRAG